MIDDAGDFDLLVLPELASSGYVFQDRDELASCAEKAGSGEFSAMLLEKAASHQAYIVGGFPERDGDRIFNSCLLAGPEGMLAVYRKAHLFMDEKRIFDPGDLEFTVIETRMGRIGMLICFDWAFPEAWRLLALQGADIVAHPSNLVTSYAQQAVPSHALCNGYFIVTANRTGTERGVSFSGRSFISGRRGEILQMSDPGFTGTHILSVDLSLARDKMVTEGNHLLDDRRPYLYKGLDVTT